MLTFQDFTLKRIEQTLWERKYVCTLSLSASNVGVVNVHYFNQHEPFARITYDFQPDTYTLTLTVSGREVTSQPGRGDYFKFYQRVTENTRFWEALDEALPG
jgi:hypothetical protein